MTKNKALIRGAISMLLITTSITYGMDELTTKTAVVELSGKPGGKPVTVTVLVKPIETVTKNFLWRLLTETKLDKEISEEKLLICANTIKRLVQQDCRLLKTRKRGTTPQKFAEQYCYPEVSKALYHKLGTRTTYVPCDEATKKKNELWAQKYAEQLTPKMMGVVEKCLQINKAETTYTEVEDIALEERIF